MSCWIVEDAHISAMLTFMQSRALHGCYAWENTETRYADGTTVQEMNRVGQILLDANYASYDHRYPRDAGGEVPRYRFKATRVLTAAEMLKAIDCYEYQSCERDDWKQSEACEIVNRMRARAISVVPGWEAAPWGFNDSNTREVRA